MIPNIRRNDRLIDRFVNSTEDGMRNFIKETGLIIIFLVESTKAIFHRPSRYLEVMRHMEFVGNQSIMIISLTGAFTGLALSLQDL